MSDFFRFILRIVLYLFIIAVLFIGISIWRGGDLIRYTGNIIHRASEKAASVSDSIYHCRKEAESFCRGVKKKVTELFQKDGDADKGK